ncbi:ArsR/SmtB family transcription factor [Natronosalvus rutilus]|uniref:Helix-turn-helix domain-containing protein n=1 Tax=Natronosalvus rutilus TaxID=2953753 RepID=A0A9E7N8S1_9EURY|nr:helix-turn-helix domain-containing protein [Natronosalvus rutilus]UTF52594.1 helix-turn-helix domain-containing protein [Natronosalvus rutilus]
MSSNDDVFQALADSTRRLILEELTDNSEQTLYELCVRLTMEHDIDMSRQGVSNHLEVLEEAGLIASSRRGKYKVLEFAGADQIEAVATWLDRLAEKNTDTETEKR